jgi:hypothetical protein
MVPRDERWEVAKYDHPSLYAPHDQDDCEGKDVTGVLYRTFGLRRLLSLRKSFQHQTFGYPRIGLIKILGSEYLNIVSTAKLIELWVVETTDPKRDFLAKKVSRFQSAE